MSVFPEWSQVSLCGIVQVSDTLLYLPPPPLLPFSLALTLIPG